MTAREVIAEYYRQKYLRPAVEADTFGRLDAEEANSEYTKRDAADDTGG